ncbi:hypothetical protein BCR32DRAFT_288342 [Anaeromyces robustus]|uniref:Uncharacterized protein n=1 Tax=Anaeromyces robustus TaxID=1754192 RepID=A0A1Y1UZU6_9FUNG|nr:hypothetical protein BCR32DRAFT_288342 [Anaeromyces robustus]|eukprot:ORX43496.1 hypothetical protein BCR32DRAFT_288342 [Anaeromyces robustus]
MKIFPITLDLLSKNINIWLCYAKKYHKKFFQSHLIYLSKNINIWLCLAKKYHKNFSQSHLIYLLKVAQKPDKYENFKIYATNTYYSLNVAQNPLKSCAKSCLITIYLLKKTRSKNINIWLCYAKKYHKKFFPITLDLSLKSYAKSCLITIYPLEKTRSENINIQLCYAKKYNEKFSQSHLIYLLKVAQNPV